MNIIGLRPNIESKKQKDLIKENVEESLCELDRPRGGYKIIFPLKNNVEKYKKIFLENIPEEDRQLWEQLIERRLYYQILFCFFNKSIFL